MSCRSFRKLADTHLTWQVRLAMCLLLLLCLGVGITCYLSLSRIDNSIRQQIQQHEKLARPTAHISVLTLQCRRYEKDMFLNVADRKRFEDYFTRWSNAVDQLIGRIDVYRNSVAESKQVMIAEKWLANVTIYQHEMLAIVNDIRQGLIRTPAQANAAIAPCKNTIRSIIINSTSVFDHEFAMARHAQKDLLTQTDYIQKLISMVLAIVIFLALIALVIIPRRIVQPIESLERAARQLRDGHMSCRLSEDFPNNELGQLAMTFNEMAQRLEDHEKQLVKAKEDSDQLNAAKTRFLMNMSHELRTPLTAILGFAQLLEDDSGEDESIEAITRSGQHLLKIVDDLLQLTEIECGQYKLNLTTINVSDMIDELAEEFMPLAHDKRLQLVVSQKPECLIIADWQKLNSVFHHLLENAIKFTDQGQIHLRCDQSEDNEQFIFEIKDTGVGMSGQQITGAGQLFNMGDDSLTRHHGGTGTGLALCKRLLEYMGGQLSITSQPGLGTTVLVRLPICQQISGQKLADCEQQASQHVPQFPEASEQKCVLVADDTPEIQKLLKTLLQQCEIKVDLADNGQMALEMAMRAHLNDHPYDLLIMDMQMPEMDGYTATRQLRLQGYQYPIVALTAHAMEGDRQKCLDAGCDDYMCKPLDPAMFKRYVRHWLEHPMIRVI